MIEDQAALEVSEPTIRVRRLHVSLRSFFVLITFIALGFAFVSAYGGGGDAWILLFLMGIGPLSVWIEYQLSKPIWDRTVGSLKRTKRRAWTWLAFALGPLCMVSAWWVYLALEIEWASLEPPVIIGIVALVLDEPGLFILPWLSFLLLYGDFLFFIWPRPIPFRIPFLLGVFSLLNFTFVIIDIALGFEANLVFAWGSIGINTVALGGMWAYWWLGHKRASFVRALILGMFLHCWLFGLGFTVVGKAEAEIGAQFLDLSGMFEPGPAPQVNVAGWEKMQTGLTRKQVEALLGGEGYVNHPVTSQIGTSPPIQTPEYWEYNWHGSGVIFADIHDEAYVVWFDSSGRVAAFRGPLNSEAKSGGDRNANSLHVAPLPPINP